MNENEDMTTPRLGFGEGFIVDIRERKARGLLKESRAQQESGRLNITSRPWTGLWAGPGVGKAVWRVREEKKRAGRTRRGRRIERNNIVRGPNGCAT